MYTPIAPRTRPHRAPRPPRPPRPPPRQRGPRRTSDAEAITSCSIHARTPAKKSSTYKLPTVLVSSTQMLYKLSWAWAWV